MAEYRPPGAAYVLACGGSGRPLKVGVAANAEGRLKCRPSLQNCRCCRSRKAVAVRSALNGRAFFLVGAFFASVVLTFHNSGDNNEASPVCTVRSCLLGISRCRNRGYAGWSYCWSGGRLVRVTDCRSKSFGSCSRWLGDRHPDSASSSRLGIRFAGGMPHRQVALSAIRRF
jgi:hypothetical protein